MEKFPLSPEGILRLQKTLYQLDDDALAKEAQSIAEDFLCWAATRIELEVHSLEILRRLPDTFRRALGWSFATCLIARRPFRLQDLRSRTSISAPFRVMFFETLSFYSDDVPSGNFEIMLYDTHS